MRRVTGLAQSQRNANDGISISQTAEGALNQVNDNLQRVRELTVQAQNGTNSQDDLTSIQNEIGQRLNEINRISEETSFNGVKVLASDQGVKIQVGANDGEAITVSLSEINAETLGLATFNVDGKADLDKLVTDSAQWTEAAGVYTNTRDNDAVTASVALDKLVTGDTVAVTDNASDVTTYTFDAEKGNFSYSQDTTAAGLTGLVSALNTQIGTGAKSDITFEANGKQTGINIDAAGAVTAAPAGGSPTQATRDELIQFLAETQGAKLTVDDTTYETTTAHLNGTAAGVVSITGLTKSAEDLVEEIESNTGGTTAVTYGAAAGSVVTGSVALNAEGKSTTQFVDADGNFTTNATSAVTYGVDGDGVVTQTNGAKAGSTAYIGADGKVTTDATTQGDKTADPLSALDAALNQVDSLRSDLGAIQNRFESAITNLSTNETNLSAARSRIEDADYAVEVANMTRAQILQQAGTSVLAQANQIPQNVLSLLG